MPFLLPDCALEISQHYRVPIEIVQAVRTQEGGKVGGVVGPNRNGTYDIGPMQINTRWWRASEPLNLSQYGISMEEVRDNECTNFAVGTWVLRLNYDQYGNWYKAVAAYNAGAPNKAGRVYADRVFAKISTKKEVILASN